MDLGTLALAKNTAGITMYIRNDSIWIQRVSKQCLSRITLHTEEGLARSILGICNRLSVCIVQFSRSVVSDSFWPYELQHARPPCPSPTPRVHPNPCPLTWWCHPTISSSVIPFSFLSSIFPSIRLFFNESAFRIKRPKYWSWNFNISPSNEHSGLISFRVDWLDLLAVQGTLKSLLQHHSSKTSILRCSAFFTLQLSHLYMLLWLSCFSHVLLCATP